MNLIKQIRRHKGMTQEELAKRCGVDRTTVCKWECDNILPRRMDIFLKLTVVLGCTADELIRNRMQNTPNGTEKRREKEDDGENGGALSIEATAL